MSAGLDADGLRLGSKKPVLRRVGGLCRREFGSDPLLLRAKLLRPHPAAATRSSSNPLTGGIVTSAPPRTN
ncbi:hypothetical protein [Streptomyces axinellae]|uniref:Uncharacterized protein n=1 Tax=Streptomyces axinellae TaxID=552788 RepID=A0ABN3QD04_9ACTN